jgi:crotonobetainyl-CoA:carnitine CoA-transferase CaiB-like acyl-CoA transferase
VLRRINSGLIMLRVSGYGQTGPYKERPGFVEDEDLGEAIIVPNVIPRLSRTPGRIDRLGPRLGQHADEVLKGLLGVGDDKVAALHAQRVI